MTDFIQNESRIDGTIKAQTFRFKFSEKMCDLLLEFSQQNKFNYSKDEFKENWHIWTLENHEEIRNEQQRLIEMGYDGDIMDKMYKSVRYYYCKKHTKYIETQHKRQKYISKNKCFIELIDTFIQRQYHNTLQNDNDKTVFNMKPSNGWKLFQEIHAEAINRETQRIIKENNLFNKSNAIEKIKKTFNNRYFINIRSQTA